MTGRQSLSCVLLGLVLLGGYGAVERVTPIPTTSPVAAYATARITPAGVYLIAQAEATPTATMMVPALPSMTVPAIPSVTMTPTREAATDVPPAATPEKAAPGFVSVPAKREDKSSTSLFSVFMAPINRAAHERREAQRADDPQKYDRQVDANLARLGTTFLLLVCGLDHEPPLVEQVMVCSNSVFLVRHNGTIDTITFTHDTRFPEQERAEGVLGQPGSARRSDALWIRRASNDSGLRVLKEGYRNATGLPIDFVLVMQSDIAVKDLVDRVLGKLPVDVPIGFSAHPIYLDEKTRMPAVTFRAGAQQMDGAAVLQYMKAVPVAETYPPELENNERKHTVFRAIFSIVEGNKFNPFFWPPFMVNLYDWVRIQVSSENIVCDFDVRALIMDNLGAVAERTQALIFERRTISPGIPVFGQSRYYVDPNLGVYKQSPIQWGTRDSGDRLAQRDIEELKIYDDYYVEVPKNGDALGPDLAAGYWKPVRQDIRTLLLGE